MAPDLLSPHLSVAEFLTTRHLGLLEQQRLGWAQPGVRESAARFATSVFERVRSLTGPLRVTSGYRCPALNRAVGGRPTSRHVLALAADVQPTELGLHEAMRRIVAAMRAGALLDLDEAIIECDAWIHLQAAAPGVRPRQLALVTADGLKYRPYQEVT